MEVLNVVALVVAGLMVGCELSIAAFIHPTLETLREEVHLPAASAIARVMGAAMPFWYALTLLMTVLDGAIYLHTSGRLPVWIAASSVLWMLVIVCTVTILVSINNRIASWETSTPPADWKRYRSRWDLLHRWRVFVLTTAFVLLIVGIL